MKLKKVILYGIKLNLVALLVCLTSCSVDPSGNNRSWDHYGGNPDQSRYFKSSEINQTNVSQLEVAWFYPTDDDNSYQINPLIVDTVMYVMAKNHSLVALNAKTGKEIWIHTGLRRIGRRGFNYWESKEGTNKRIIFTLGNSLQAIDAVTGKSIESFGTNGYVDLREHLDRDPTAVRRVQPMMPGVIFEDLVIMGSSPGEGYFSPPGYVRAYHVVTGDLVWIFRTIPKPGEYGYETWPKDAHKYVGGTNVWSEMSVDVERGIVFLPVGSPTYDFYGADREGNNLFGNCLVALNARTGERLWHYQTVHHDLWDYDPASAPQLITITREGKEIDAVSLATKHGFVFVFDRETGEPIFPIEEKAFPASSMPGEKASPTQPIPSLPPFTRHEVTIETLNPYFSDSIKLLWQERLDKGKSGLYVPPSDQYETIIMPGSLGGTNFGNTGSDPSNGIMYIMSGEHAGIYQLEKVEPPTLNMPSSQVAQVKSIYETNCQTCHGASMEGGLGPPLKNIGQQLYYFQFEEVVKNGRGRMPGFVHLTDETLRDLYLFLGGNPESLNFRFRQQIRQSGPVQGPVVDSGGIEMLPDESYVAALSDYPVGVEHPENRYRTDYGTEWPALLGPPWSYIVAYDLNEGIIKWKQPVGLDSVYARGDKTFGAPGGVARKGMVVTSTGIVFATGKGGQLHALDAETGKVLWETTLSHESEGPPGMFSIDGRDYLVVNATTDFAYDSYDHSVRPNALPKGYVVYGLPVDQ